MQMEVQSFTQGHDSRPSKMLIEVPLKYQTPPINTHLLRWQQRNYLMLQQRYGSQETAVLLSLMYRLQLNCSVYTPLDIRRELSNIMRLRWSMCCIGKGTRMANLRQADVRYASVLTREACAQSSRTNSYIRSLLSRHLSRGGRIDPDSVRYLR